MSSTQTISSESPAHLWFVSNLPEIKSRARACFSLLDGDARQEALAEVMASVFKASVSADRRGVLAKITPFHAVDYAVRQHCQGRRFAGSTSRDVMGERTRRRGRVVVQSLSDPAPAGRDNALTVAEALADRRSTADPFNQTRMNLDYPEILRRERVSRKARRVFKLLMEVRGQGSVNHIAALMGFTPARVCHLKHQLADALRKHGYAPDAPESPDSPRHPR